MTMHAGNIESSDRLQRVHELLKARAAAGATTREIIDLTGVCAVNSIVSELRHNGIAIECKFESVSERGARIYRYTLAEKKHPLDLFGQAI